MSAAETTETAETRTRILAEAKRLFSLHGYHGLSMRVIAEAAQISKAGLYYHFADKEELFVAILTSYLDELGALIRGAEAEGTNCRARINLVVHRILAQPSEQRAVIRLASQEIGGLSAATQQTFHEVYYEKFIGRIAAILRAGIASGELRPLDPTVATWTLLGMMYPYFYPSSSLHHSSTSEIVDQLVTIYFDGVSAPADNASTTSRGQ